MNVSRFFGATNREAMRQVRMALGPEALIVSNRRVNGGVEILATDQTSVPPAEASGLSAAPVSQYPAPRQPPGNSPADVMQALGSMRGLLENGFDELLWGAQLRKAPQAVSLFQKLLSMGFSTALLRAMLRRLPETASAHTAFQWCRDELVDHLPVLASEDELWAPGTVLALVGPTGVGKTTTIAKLAARCVRRFGATSLVLITTDTYRIGAHEQLRIYGRMMGVPVHVAQDHAELSRLILAADPGVRILVDNVGISQRDRHVGEQAAMLDGLSRPVRRLLVLNAASQGDTLDEVARAYTNDGGSRPAGCIVTKLDESPRLAPALDIAIRYQLPIHYGSTGQKVPEDLAFMDAEAWVDQALVPSQPASALFSPSAADLAALMAAPAPQPPSRKAAVPLQSMLPGLLALAGVQGRGLDARVFEAAGVELESAAVYSGACHQWRQVVSDTDHVGASWRPLAVARSELASLDQEHMLALHDAVKVSTGSAAQKLHATVLLGQYGRALTTPWQQWSVGSGWQASDGTSGPQALPAAELLRRQIDFLDQSPGASSVVHVFSSPGQGLLRDLCKQPIHWLAHCAGATRVEAQSCPTTMAAHAKTLDYRCLDSVLSRLDMAFLQGVPICDVALWAASGRVELAARGAASLPLEQVSVRLIDRRSGKVLKSLHGLSRVSVAQVGLDILASWLMMRAEVSLASRYLPRLWSALDEAGGQRPVGQRAAATIQMALAVWHAVQAGQSVQQALVALAGASGPNSFAASASAFARLLVVKDLAERSGVFTRQ